MKRFWLISLLVALALGTPLLAQKDKDEGPTSWLNFVVLKDDNGKPVRNAAVIMHPVDPKGKQEKGGMELKTDLDGKADFNGIPYGPLRVQVLAHGFQTYGDDFDINQPKMSITIKLKRPSSQYSIYGNTSGSASDKPNSPPDAGKNPPDANKK